MELEQVARLKCFSRVRLVNPDGTIAGDSGWTGPNIVTNLGLQNFLAGAMAGNAGSKQVARCAVGTGGIPASNATALPGEVMASTQRVTVDKSFSSRTVSNGSCTQWFYATFTSGFVTGAGSTLNNVGLFATTETNDTLFCGNTYTGSACASNQAVNVTYQIQLGHS